MNLHQNQWSTHVAVGSEGLPALIVHDGLSRNWTKVRRGRMAWARAPSANAIPTGHLLWSVIACRFLGREYFSRLNFPSEGVRVVNLQNGRDSRNSGMCSTREIHISCSDLFPLGTKTLHQSRLWRVQVLTVWLDLSRVAFRRGWSKPRAPGLLCFGFF